ncbi:MAG: site-specific DNA-methyltransferase [Planctomycetes bacterium]|nr:site-specific DNA-methyltransferase [Planctomycetota bacterium]
MTQILKRDGVELHLADALELAPRLPRASVDLLYLDPPFFTQREQKRGSKGYDDRWPGGLADYLAFLRRLVEACVPLLSERGVIALHLDWRAAHYGRLELERALGADNFVNEIIWSYRTGGLSKRWLARKHDTIHVFSRGPKYTFNRQTEKSYLSHRYGFSNVEIFQDEKGPYTMAAMRDVWDVAALRGNQPENAGYPTQKPQALLERLIGCFSRKGDVVADFCCGSGTTLVAAVKAGRNALGCDIGRQAVEIAQRRLKNVLGART